MYPSKPRPKLPGSLRKFIRRQKSIIRRQFSDSREADQKIKELRERVLSSRPNPPVAKENSA